LCAAITALQRIGCAIMGSSAAFSSRSAATIRAGSRINQFLLDQLGKVGVHQVIGRPVKAGRLWLRSPRVALYMHDCARGSGF
jgi:hypothetical protein